MNLEQAWWPLLGGGGGGAEAASSMRPEGPGFGSDAPRAKQAVRPSDTGIWGQATSSL